MNKRIYKLFLSLFIAILLFSKSTIPTKAQMTVEELGDALNDDNMSQEQYIIGNTEQLGLIDSINLSFYCSLASCRDSDKNLAKGGMIPEMGTFIASIYQNPVASSEVYFADVLNNIGIPTVQTANAQGVGYQMLTPMLEVWKAFRNLAYSIYIILFAVIGMMIIFRTKVNAQTIITIQSALPNLIITLILITFSYAIAGFLVDLMYFSIYFIAYLARANNLVTNADTVIDQLTNSMVFEILITQEDTRKTFINGAANAISDIFADLTGPAGPAVQFIESITWNVLPKLIVAAALAIQMLKLLWSLTRSYIMLLVQTVTAPLQILPNAIPGSTSFTTWLKKTFSYVAPFPVVAAMFIFSAYLIGQNTEIYPDNSNPFGVVNSESREEITYPPFIGFGSAVSPETFLGVLGFFVLLMTPAAAKSIQEALQVKESMYTSEIGAGLSTGFAAGTFLPRTLLARRGEKRALKDQQLMFTKAMKEAQAGKGGGES